MDIISIILGLISAGGGGAIIAFTLFKRFGDAWLKAKFDERLEAYRHDRAKEMERFRAEIDGALRARVKLQEKQFDAYLQIWNALKDAESQLLVSISPLQQYDDIKRLGEDARIEYLSSLGLQKWQVDEILGDANLQDRFIETINRMRLNDAKQSFSEFCRLTRLYELFLERKTFEIIRSVVASMRSSLISKEIAIEARDFKLEAEARKEYDEKCAPLVKELVTKFQELLKVS